MDTSPYLTNHFLIAMPNMDDPNFFQAVTYVCEHNEDGALGIVINRPTTIKLADVLEQMDIEYTSAQVDDFPILYGGPIHQERGFVIHRSGGVWRSSFQSAADVNITTSRDILKAIAEGQGPKEALISLGYAGWGAGQLEEEIMKNIWLSTDANASILFETPFKQRWARAAALIGVDINAISGDIGHA